MTDSLDIISTALRNALRELEGIPPHEEVSIAGLAPYFKASALRFIADIADQARLLLRGIDHGPPLDVSNLLDICNAIMSAADRLSGVFYFWLHVLGKDPTTVHQHVLLQAIDAITEHADTLAQVAQHADPETRLSSEKAIALVRAVLLLVEYLRQELINSTPTTTATGDVS